MTKRGRKEDEKKAKSRQLRADDKTMQMCYNGIVKNWIWLKNAVSCDMETAFFNAKNPRRRWSMLNQAKRSGKARIIYWTIVAIVAALMISVQPIMAAETIWDRFSTIMRDFYGRIVAISTIVAVTMAAVALVVRMVSRNQKAVDEATAWLKRIVITWIILNSLGFIVAYLQPLISGGNYVG